MIFKLAKKNDIPKVLFELKKFFGKNYYGANKKFFDWFYKKNPCLKLWNKSAPYSVALLKSHNGKILCISCFLPWQVICKGKKYNSVWDIEWLNVSRQKGLGRKIIKNLEKYFDLYLGFGYNSVSARSYKKLNYSLIREIDRKLYVISKYKLKSILKPLLPNQKIILPNQKRVSFLNYKIINSLKKINDKPLLAHNKNFCTSLRSKKMLSWRYLGHPFLKYKLLTTNYNDLAILRNEKIRGTKNKILRILEIFPDPKSKSRIIKAIINYAKEKDIILADFFCVSRSISKKLLGSFFIPFKVHRKFNIPYLFNPLENRKRKSINFVYKRIKRIPFNPKQFYATKGDSDQDVLLNTDYVTKKI